jgi:hypothetical protein
MVATAVVVTMATAAVAMAMAAAKSVNADAAASHLAAVAMATVVTATVVTDVMVAATMFRRKSKPATPCLRHQLLIRLPFRRPATVTFLTPTFWSAKLGSLFPMPGMPS